MFGIVSAALFLSICGVTSLHDLNRSKEDMLVGMLDEVKEMEMMLNKLQTDDVEEVLNVGMDDEEDEEVNSMFDPKSSLVTYHDHKSCGPRGDDAQADLSQCALGYDIAKEGKSVDWKVLATIDGCEYYGYTVYECKGPFDPTSSLVTYHDHKSCGPRGDDAQADLSQCGFLGHYIKKEGKFDDWKVLATIKGCEYFSYTVYRCRGQPHKTM